jgi:hypothetical protein
MGTRLETITINNIEYVRKDLVTNQIPIIVKDYVIVRTYSAGVHAGELVLRSGKDVKLKNARRLWYWDGAASLSQLAIDGVNKPQNCKFPCEVPEIILTEAIEIIPCTQKAIDSIKGVTIWKK